MKYTIKICKCVTVLMKFPQKLFNILTAGLKCEAAWIVTVWEEENLFVCFPELISVNYK